MTTPPPCSNHHEIQHRDGKPPWCNNCGWNHGTASRAPFLGSVTFSGPEPVPTLRDKIEELIADSWLNLENSSDEFLSSNYGLVVLVDDIRDILDETHD